MKKKIKDKSTADKLKNHKILVAMGSILILFMSLYLCRGFIRTAALPLAIKLSYGRSVDSVYHDETAKLQNPMALLGYKKVENLTDTCDTDLANGISTQITCEYDMRLYGQIDTSADGKKRLNANAEKLQALLKSNGWQGKYTNDEQAPLSLVKLVSSVTAGIDYQPDATYQKQIGKVLCYFHSNTAFSQPEPPAIATQISCTRTFNILGEPSWQ